MSPAFAPHLPVPEAMSGGPALVALNPGRETAGPDNRPASRKDLHGHPSISHETKTMPW